MLIHPSPPFPSVRPSERWMGFNRLGMKNLWREQAFANAAGALMKQNKPDGFACVCCAWAKPGRPHALEFCENGAKATAWELTSKKSGHARPIITWRVQNTER